MDGKLKKNIATLIRKEATPEAYKIMSIAFEEDVKEFWRYYNAKNYNIACCVIDHAKYKLVQAGKIEHKASDHFGSPYLEVDKKEFD